MKEGGRSSATGGGRWCAARCSSPRSRCRSCCSSARCCCSAASRGSRASIPDSAPTTSSRSGSRCRRRPIREDHQRVAFFDRLLARLGQLPGVRSAGMIQTLPMRGNYVLSFAVQGRPSRKPGDAAVRQPSRRQSRLFRRAGHPAEARAALHRAGHRDVADGGGDRRGVRRRHFPNEDPIGRGLDIGNGTDGFYQIVGVVGNVHHVDLEASAGPTMYVPYRQDVFSSMWMVAAQRPRPCAAGGPARQARSRASTRHCRRFR